jgi:hypothetical protein
MLGYQYHKATSTREYDVAGANDQLGAIYGTLKARGFVYSSVTEAFFAGAQNVRYPGKSLKVTTANCIDGSLVFASILEAIGMAPAVVFVPGHAYVGVHVAPAGPPNANTFIFVETTMMGTADYAAASARGAQEFKQHREAKVETVISLADVRKAGYLPSPFPL